MEKKIKNEKDLVLDLEFVNRIRMAARTKITDKSLSDNMRKAFMDLSIVCSNILAFDYIEKLDTK